MIELKNITYDKSSGNLKATAYIEDCASPVELLLGQDNEWVNEPVLPTGYDYCNMHLAHAKRYLSGLPRKEFKTYDHTVMWY